MTEIHKVECDRCGKEEDMEKPCEAFNKDETYNIPPSWENVSMDHAGVTVDLCGECERQRKAAEEQFMKQNIRSKVDLNDEELQANLKKENGGSN